MEFFKTHVSCSEFTFQCSNEYQKIIRVYMWFPTVCILKSVFWSLCKYCNFVVAVTVHEWECAPQPSTPWLISSSPSVLPYSCDPLLLTSKNAQPPPPPFVFFSLLIAPRFSGWSLCKLASGDRLLWFCPAWPHNCSFITFVCFFHTCLDSCGPLVLVRGGGG